MKNFFLPLLLLGLFAGTGKAAQDSESLEAKTARRVQESPPTLIELKPNEIKAGKLSYSGAAVQLARMDHPFQLLNPFAPAQYGWAEANIVREPRDGRVSGIKIFSINF